MKAGACRGCGAAVFWLENTTTGKSAPIDVEPSEEGNILINYEQRKYEVTAGFIRQLAQERDAELHTSHFMTCPKAEQFR